MVRPHYNLEAWKLAMKLVKTIYLATRTFPQEEIYGLTAQMRRAAVSITLMLSMRFLICSKKCHACWQDCTEVSRGSPEG